VTAAPFARVVAKDEPAAYFGTMPGNAARPARLPTTLGFSPVEDRARMPGRFFYRQISAVHLRR